MAIHRVGYQNSEGKLQSGDLTWTQAMGRGGVVRPGDVVELVPGPYTGQKFTSLVEGDPKNPILIKTVDGATEPARFDGEYKWPAGKTVRTGPDGEMVFAALLDIRTPGVKLGSGRLVNGLPSILIERSRGRGVQFAKDEKPFGYAEMNGVGARSCRSAAVMMRFVQDFRFFGNDVSRASDYYQSAHDPEEMNFPGAVAFHGCDGGEVANNRLYETWSDGFMFTMGTRNFRIHHNEIFDVAGNVGIYLHGAEDWEVDSNLLQNTGNPLWQHSHHPFDGATGIVCNNEEEPQFASLATRNGKVTNNILLNMGLGIWRNEGAERAIENIEFLHNTVLCQGTSRPIKIAQKTGPRSVSLHHNLFAHPEGEYGTVADWTGIEMIGNGWDGLPPAKWQTQGDLGYVPIRNPVAPYPTSIDNYRPTEPCGMSQPTGVDKDYEGRERKFFTVGALEYAPPPPPTKETVSLRFDVEVGADKAAALREVLAGAKVTVV